MIVLNGSYQELGRSGTYAFSDKGQVCACLYARMVDAGTVAVKLTRIITGTSSYVGYSYTSAQATLSGSLTHSWSGGASGTVYVGEHTVFESHFTVTPGTTLSLSAIYDDTYITARTVTVTCRAAGQAPDRPTVTRVDFDPALPTRQAKVTVCWTGGNADRYHVSVCRLNVSGNPSAGGIILYQADIYEPRITFDLATLLLAVGDDLYFMVSAHNAAGNSGNGFSDYYRIYPTVWVCHNAVWVAGAPWVYQQGQWLPALALHVKDGEWL